MTLTFPTIGQEPWGAVLNTLIRQAVSQDLPDDHGLAGWAFPLSAVSAQSAPATGVLQLTRIPVRANQTITNLYCSVGVAGVTLTAGQNFMALYNSAGTRVGVSADQTAAFGSIGNKTVALTAPVAATTGFYWVAWLFNGTTAPQLTRNFTSASLANNLGSTAATSFAGTFGAAQTSTPASFAPGSITQAQNTIWAGWS